MTAKKTGWLAAGLLCLALWPGAALSQSTALDVARHQLDSFYRQGRYESAIAAGQEAHALAVAEFGAEHRETLAIQLGLAEAYRAQARFAEAEPLFLETLEIVQACVALAPYRSNQAFALIEPERLRVNLVALGNRADHQELCSLFALA